MLCVCWNESCETLRRGATAERGLQKLCLCGLAQLRFKCQVGVSGWTVAVLFLAGGGIYKFSLYGSRSRGDVGAVIYASLAAVALIFLGEAWVQSEPVASLARALKMAAIAVPVLLFLHLQLMPGDIVLQAHVILKLFHEVKDIAAEKSWSHAWGFKAGWRGVKDVLAWYRRDASRAQRQMCSRSACFQSSHIGSFACSTGLLSWIVGMN